MMKIESVDVLRDRDTRKCNNGMVRDSRMRYVQHPEMYAQVPLCVQGVRGIILREAYTYELVLLNDFNVNFEEVTTEHILMIKHMPLEIRAKVIAIVWKAIKTNYDPYIGRQLGKDGITTKLIERAVIEAKTGIKPTVNKEVRIVISTNPINFIHQVYALLRKYYEYNQDDTRYEMRPILDLIAVLEHRFPMVLKVKK